MSLLDVNGLCKAWSGVTALNDVSLQLNAGEVHALCGENGAGKSTLIKCLAGVVVPDDGSVKLDERPLKFGSVAKSEDLGIAVIHQESTTFPDLNAVDNIFVGREYTGRFGMLDYKAMRRETASLMKTLGEDVDLSRPLAEMSLANRQMVAIARALSRQCRLLIMDEPTASLSARETEVLMRTVRRLSDQGVTILYVSHRLAEVFALADCVTVLRDGQLVETSPANELDEASLIRLMVGGEANAAQTQADKSIGEIRLDVRELCGSGFHDISLSVRAGEIVGLAGLVGAGRSELARAIMGLDAISSGEVLVKGSALTDGDMRSALEHGLALVPEDRQHEGLILPMSVSCNLNLTRSGCQSPFAPIRARDEDALANQFVERLSIRTESTRIPVQALSGGNQQKVVLGKWLATNPRILILDEPTRESTSVQRRRSTTSFARSRPRGWRR